MAASEQSLISFWYRSELPKEMPDSLSYTNSLSITLHPSLSASSLLHPHWISLKYYFLSSLLTLLRTHHPSYTNSTFIFKLNFLFSSTSSLLSFSTHITLFLFSKTHFLISRRVSKSSNLYLSDLNNELMKTHNAKHPSSLRDKRPRDTRPDSGSIQVSLKWFGVGKNTFLKSSPRIIIKDSKAISAGDDLLSLFTFLSLLLTSSSCTINHCLIVFSLPGKLLGISVSSRFYGWCNKQNRESLLENWLNVSSWSQVQLKGKE